MTLQNIVAHCLHLYTLDSMIMKLPKKTDHLSAFELEKICHLLQCDRDEFFEFEKIAHEIAETSENTFEALMNILQKGHNVREASLIAMLIGRLEGYQQAEADMEEDIKEQLFQAFKRNRGN